MAFFSVLPDKGFVELCLNIGIFDSEVRIK